MWIIWVQLVMVCIGIIIYFSYISVFCFWSIYLVDAIKRKRSFYKTALRCVEGGSDPCQQMLAYNAKTEIVKFASLFCLNLVEWVGVTFAIISLILHFVGYYQQEFSATYLVSVSGEWGTELQIQYLDNICLVISMTIIGSLCLYLSARYAQNNCIKSNKIPYWIFFFLFSAIVSKIMVTICYTNIIGIWFHRVLILLSVVFAWKQYRKLNMVIQWSIVDLRVSGEIELLAKHICMKRRFNRIFLTIWIGVTCMLVALFIDVLSQTVDFLLHMYRNSITDGLFCGTKVNSHPDTYVRASVYSIEGSLTIIGVLFIFIPYIGYGLCTMCVVLWRLFRGKTGYRTHFHVQLITPLIKP